MVGYIVANIIASNGQKGTRRGRHLKANLAFNFLNKKVDEARAGQNMFNF